MNEDLVLVVRHSFEFVGTPLIGKWSRRSGPTRGSVVVRSSTVGRLPR